jgi:hypothetical protein
MTTLNNVKEIKLKGKRITDIDNHTIDIPKAVYENGEIKRDINGNIIYEPSSLLSTVLLSEISLPIIYSLENEIIDPADPNYKNKLVSLSSIIEMNNQINDKSLKIYDDYKYQFGDDNIHSFGLKENMKPLSVEAFKDTVIHTEFSSDHVYHDSFMRSEEHTS